MGLQSWMPLYPLPQKHWGNPETRVAENSGRRQLQPRQEEGGARAPAWQPLPGPGLLALAGCGPLTQPAGSCCTAGTSRKGATLGARWPLGGRSAVLLCAGQPRAPWLGPPGSSQACSQGQPGSGRGRLIWSAGDPIDTEHCQAC